MKRIYLVIALVFVLSLFPLTQAALDDSIGATAENVSGKVDGAREIIEEERWNAIGEGWKDIFLNNTYIAPVDRTFHLLNPFFVFFFAKDYSFSLEFLLMFMLWLATLIIVHKYVRFLVQEPSVRFVIALPIVIILSHVQLFNLLARLAFRVILYKSSLIWQWMSFFIIVIAIVFYIYLGNLFSHRFAKLKEKKEKEALAQRVELLETKDKASKRALRG